MSDISAMRTTTAKRVGAKTAQRLQPFATPVAGISSSALISSIFSFAQDKRNGFSRQPIR
ncbi:MAG: hypothetical protein R6W95_04805 [Desulfosarcina sp.]